jgi:hypothetical protein
LAKSAKASSSAPPEKGFKEEREKPKKIVRF